MSELIVNCGICGTPNVLAAVAPLFACPTCNTILVKEGDDLRVLDSRSSDDFSDPPVSDETQRYSLVNALPGLNNAQKQWLRDNALAFWELDTPTGSGQTLHEIWFGRNYPVPADDIVYLIRSTVS